MITYCDISNKSISSASTRSTNGKASIPDNPGWIPQSSCKNIKCHYLCCTEPHFKQSRKFLITNSIKQSYLKKNLSSIHQQMHCLVQPEVCDRVCSSLSLKLIIRQFNPVHIQSCNKIFKTNYNLQKDTTFDNL